MHTVKWKSQFFFFHSFGNGYILYDSMYMTFQKKEKHRDGKQWWQKIWESGGFEKIKHRGFFRALKLIVWYCDGWYMTLHFQNGVKI